MCTAKAHRPKRKEKSMKYSSTTIDNVSETLYKIAGKSKRQGNNTAYALSIGKESGVQSFEGEIYHTPHIILYAKSGLEWLFLNTYQTDSVQSNVDFERVDLFISGKKSQVYFIINNQLVDINNMILIFDAYESQGCIAGQRVFSPETSKHCLYFDGTKITPILYDKEIVQCFYDFILHLNKKEDKKHVEI